MASILMNMIRNDQNSYYKDRVEQVIAFGYLGSQTFSVRVLWPSEGKIEHV